MAIQVLMNQVAGPLPKSVTFKAPSDAQTYLEVAGSVWTQSANSMIGIQISLDNNIIGKAQIFSNTASTHRAVVNTYIPVQLAFGQHTLALTALPGTTVSDLNDFFTVVLHY